MYRNRTTRLTLLAVLSAMAYLLMLFEIVLPFFPAYLKYDLSDIPGLFAAFTLGPGAGVLVEIIKDLLKMAINPGDGGVIGVVANLLAGVSLIGAAGLTRRLLGQQQSVLRDLIALITGTLVMSVVMLLANGLVIFPVYFHVPPAQVWSTAMAISTPFNLVKGTLSAVAAVLLARPLARPLARLRPGSMAPGQGR